MRSHVQRPVYERRSTCSSAPHSVFMDRILDVDGCFRPQTAVAGVLAAVPRTRARESSRRTVEANVTPPFLPSTRASAPCATVSCIPIVLNPTPAVSCWCIVLRGAVPFYHRAHS